VKEENKKNTKRRMKRRREIRGEKNTNKRRWIDRRRTK
jgi:hypothetical protein